MQLPFLDHALSICNVCNRRVSFPFESTGLLNITSDNQSDNGNFKRTNSLLIITSLC